MKLLVPILAVALLTVATAAPCADAPALVVLLPLDNLSGVAEAPAVVGKALEDSLARKGWTIAERGAVETLLEDERVRYLDSLPAAVRERIVAETGASAIISCSIHSYAAGTNAVVSLSVRMVRRDGTLAWTEIAGLSADETEGAFGRGRQRSVEDVAATVVAKLTRTLPAPGEEKALPRGEGGGLFRGDATSYRSVEFDAFTGRRICVLPFENLSQSIEAPRVVAEVLALRLAASGFEVVDPVQLREAALQVKTGSLRQIANDGLLRLAPVLGTPLFLKGTIYRFHDVNGKAGDVPQLEIEYRLVDVLDGRVLWAVQHQRAGSDYTGFMLRGQVGTALVLTDRTVTEMIDAGGRPSPRAAEKLAAARAARKKEAHSELRAPRKGEEKP